MVSSYKFDVNKVGAFFCPVSLKCGNIKINLKDESLIDTGAGICHMTYAMWCDIGLHKVCFEDKKELLGLMGVSSPEEMTFDKLPFSPKWTKLGDGSLVPAYEFRLDELRLGVGASSIVFNNITVRILNSDEISFLIGLNVLRYLKIGYDPSTLQSICCLTLDTNGRQLLEDHRVNRGVNNMQSTFNYLQQPPEKW